MTPEVFDIYNKSLVNLVNEMFEDFDIKDFLTAEARKRLVRDGRLVCRHNKIDLADICRFLMQPRTETMNVESQVFLELIGRQTDVTKEDIIERRSDLDPEAFRDFNLRLSDKVYSGHLPRINADRLIMAFDGSTVSLQQTDVLMDEFGGHPGKNPTGVGSPLSRSEFLVDTETECIIDAEFGKFRSDEGSMAISIIDRLPQSVLDRHPIALFDRKYCGFRTIYAAMRKGIDFVIRVKRNFSKQTDDFIKSGKQTDVLVLEPTPQSVRKHRRKYPDEQFGGKVTVHMCRAYDGNEPVILMSSMHLEPEQGAAFYTLRWKAESAIDNYKNLFQVEIFSGNRPIVVRQDFYSRLISYNFFYLFLHAATMSCLKSEERENTDSSKKLKYAYRLNANASLHRFKEVFPRLCYPCPDESLSLNLIKFMTKFHEPIRPNRHLTRKFRALKLFGKYITVQNYRRAI